MEPFELDPKITQEEIREILLNPPQTIEELMELARMLMTEESFERYKKFVDELSTESAMAQREFDATMKMVRKVMPEFFN